MAKNTKTILILGGLGLLGFYLFSKRAAISGAAAKLVAAAVGAGEQVSAGTYRVIANRRPGLDYVPASGAVGGTISFTSPSAGMFTRNIVQEQGGLFAEIAPSGAAA